MRGAIKWTAALLLIGALGVGWSAMTADGNNAPAPAAHQPEPTEHPQAPTEIPEQLPVAAPGASETDPVVDDDPRFHQDEAGARAAAVAYLELTEEAVSMTPAEAAALQRSIATADFAEEFGADTEQKMDGQVVRMQGERVDVMVSGLLLTLRRTKPGIYVGSRSGMEFVVRSGR